MPPRFMLAFFRWFCRREYLEDIEGDLLERFHKRKALHGASKARWSFIIDVLKLCRPAIIRQPAIQPQNNFRNMKQVNWKKLAGLNLLVVLMIVSPFIPGPSNKVVLAISVLGQVAGIFGLLLVPTGLAWTVIELRKLKCKTSSGHKVQLHYYLAIGAALLVAFTFFLAALLVPNPMPKISFFVGFAISLTGIILALNQTRKWKANNEHVSDHGAVVILAASATSSITFIYIFVSLFAFVGVGIIPGILVLFFLPVGLWWIITQIRKLKESEDSRFNSVPVYLVTVPLIAFVTLLFLVTPASDFSRNFAIKKSDTLIASIEDYKNRTGRYPESLHELYPGPGKKMPKPSVMGIGEFRYNKIDDSYSLSFSQWLHVGSLEEIVLYDKSDLKDNLTAKFPKYDYNVDLWRIKGAFASHDTRYSKWRYYHVD